MKTTRLIIAGLSMAALLAGASTAFAQSTVTGTLSSGGSSSTGSGNTITGTVSGSGSTSSGGSSGGGGGSGSGTNVVDICPNLSGTQSTLPSGYVISGGNCVQTTGSTSGTGTTGSGSTGTTGSTSGSGSVLGTSTGNPNVPNTGAGGDAAATMLVLATSALAALGGARLMLKRA